MKRNKTLVNTLLKFHANRMNDFQVTMPLVSKVLTLVATSIFVLSTRNSVHNLIKS